MGPWGEWARLNGTPCTPFGPALVLVATCVAFSPSSSIGPTWLSSLLPHVRLFLVFTLITHICMILGDTWWLVAMTRQRTVTTTLRCIFSIYLFCSHRTPQKHLALALSDSFSSSMFIVQLTVIL